MDKISEAIFNIPESYRELLKYEIDNHLYDDIFLKTIELYKKETIYPPYNKIYRSLELLPVNKVKVIIIGQDPYIHNNQANGLAFSVDCEKLPPSLKNIYKELNYEYGYDEDTIGDLSSWEEQGVLLLNSILIVKDSESLSCKDVGWEDFTSAILSHLVLRNPNIIFMLWGNNAIDLVKNLKVKNVIKTSHPSPLSFYQGFYKSNCFKKVNELLSSMKEKEINWEIKNPYKLF